MDDWEKKKDDQKDADDKWEKAALLMEMQCAPDDAWNAEAKRLKEKASNSTWPKAEGEPYCTMP